MFAFAVWQMSIRQILIYYTYRYRIKTDENDSPVSEGMVDDGRTPGCQEVTADLVSPWSRKPLSTWTATDLFTWSRGQCHVTWLNSHQQVTSWQAENAGRMMEWILSPTVPSACARSITHGHWLTSYKPIIDLFIWHLQYTRNCSTPQ